MSSRQPKKTSHVSHETPSYSVTVDEDTFIPYKDNVTYVDDGKALYARFIVPRQYYRSANQREAVYSVARRNNWLRAYAYDVWLKAIEAQFGITPHSVDEDTYNALVQQADMSPYYVKYDEQYATAYREYEEQCKITAHYKDKYGVRHSSYKAQKARERELKKYADKLLSKRDKARQKYIQHELHAVTVEDSLNRGSMLFPQTVRVEVIVYNISAHEFDSPNFYLTMKALQDGGTDTGILWVDDNNSVIVDTRFYGYEMKDRNNYVFDIKVTPVKAVPQGIDNEV